jgi:hypothetical protein
MGAAPQAGRLAEHFAGVVPLDPVQFQVQGPVPLTAEAVPAEQRLLAGAVFVKVPLADPHAPALDALLTVFWTLRLKVTVEEVPPDCPGATEKATTLIEFVPFAS